MGHAEWDIVGSKTVDEGLPSPGIIDSKSNVIDTRGSPAINARQGRFDQVDHRATIRI